MSVTLEELIQRAGVDHGFVRRLHELGAFGSDDDRYEERDVHVAALLRMWERAGLSIPSILAAVEAGRLSLDFLDAPAWELPEPLPITYREFADEQGIPFELLQGIQAAMGFAAPDPDDRVARSSATATSTGAPSTSPLGSRTRQRRVRFSPVRRPPRRPRTPPSGSSDHGPRT